MRIWIFWRAEYIPLQTRKKYWRIHKGLSSFDADRFRLEALTECNMEALAPTWCLIQQQALGAKTFLRLLSCKKYWLYMSWLPKQACSRFYGNSDLELSTSQFTSWGQGWGAFETLSYRRCCAKQIWSKAIKKHMLVVLIFMIAIVDRQQISNTNTSFCSLSLVQSLSLFLCSWPDMILPKNNSSWELVCAK